MVVPGFDPVTYWTSQTHNYYWINPVAVCINFTTGVIKYDSMEYKHVVRPVSCSFYPASAKPMKK